MTLSQFLSFFSLSDWLAFFACWPAFALYSFVADRAGRSRDCLHSVSRRSRLAWSRATADRPIDGRMVDAAMLGTLNNSAVFFASSALLALGAFLSFAVSPERARDALDAMHSLSGISPDTTIFLIKAVVASGFFGWSFLKFSWSMRQIAFASAVAASFPAPSASDEGVIQGFAELVSLAGESFNSGLRSFYWSMAAAAWLVSPWACLICAGALFVGLWRREFASQTLSALSKAHPR